MPEGEQGGSRQSCVPPGCTGEVQPKKDAADAVGRLVDR